MTARSARRRVHGRSVTSAAPGWWLVRTDLSSDAGFRSLPVAEPIICSQNARRQAADRTRPVGDFVGACVEMFHGSWPFPFLIAIARVVLIRTAVPMDLCHSFEPVVVALPGGCAREGLLLLVGHLNIGCDLVTMITPDRSRSDARATTTKCLFPDDERPRRFNDPAPEDDWPSAAAFSATR